MKQSFCLLIVYPLVLSCLCFYTICSTLFVKNVISVIKNKRKLEYAKVCFSRSLLEMKTEVTLKQDRQCTCNTAAR